MRFGAKIKKGCAYVLNQILIYLYQASKEEMSLKLARRLLKITTKLRLKEIQFPRYAVLYHGLTSRQREQGYQVEQPENLPGRQ